MPAASKNHQRAFQETVLEDPELERLCEELVESKAMAAPANKNYRQAKKDLDRAIAMRNLGPQLLEESLRVGEYVIEGKSLAGGPTEIPAWESITLKVEKRQV